MCITIRQMVSTSAMTGTIMFTIKQFRETKAKVLTTLEFTQEKILLHRSSYTKIRHRISNSPSRCSIQRCTAPVTIWKNFKVSREFLCRLTASVE